jgi:hypothetical protein
MATIAQLEVRRLQAQQRLDSEKGADQRNRAGQFATPPGLAREIATYARQLWGERKDSVRFLDPALGTGSFYSALRQVFPPARVAGAAGIELDPSFARAAASLWGAAGLKVIQGDFTATEPPPPDRRFNLLLTNPPYVRHHHLGQEQKRRLQGAVARDLGIRVSGLAGLYCHFLLLADRWLSEGGLAVWLVPSEFMDVNYGQAVKRYLTQQVTLLHVHRFSPADVQFADALVSSAVVVFTKEVPPAGHTVRFTLGGTLLRPQLEQQVSPATLRKTRKWTNHPRAGGSGTAARDPGIVLGDLFTIKRGLATGANDFFILPRHEAARWGIPASFTKPILPSPRHLALQVIEADRDGAPRLTPALALIDCDRPEEELRARYSTFWEYLQAGKRRGIDQGYLASRRSPWYSQEKREPAPFLCTYMGREMDGRKPFRFIWNQSAALASNLYLLLYPKGALRAALAGNPRAQADVFSALQEIDTAAFLREGRVYGGGLYKLEPKELGRIPATPILKVVQGLELVRQGELFTGE